MSLQVLLIVLQLRLLLAVEMLDGLWIGIHHREQDGWRGGGAIVQLRAVVAVSAGAHLGEEEASVAMVAVAAMV